MDLPLDAEADDPPRSDSRPSSCGAAPDAPASTFQPTTFQPTAFHALSAPSPSLLGFRIALQPPPPRSISMPSLPRDAGGAEAPDSHTGGGRPAYGALAPWELPACLADDAALDLEPELAGLLQAFAD